jgi:hypothetical protein
MSRVLLRIPGNLHRAVRAHLLPEGGTSEEAGFIFARRSTADDDEVFECIEWLAIPPEGFVTRTDFHIELTDEMRAAVIKRAHDRDASLVEFHAHTGPWPASFSPSDHLGFDEFVPHAWWRLKGKPYLAVVVTRTGFDSLVWLEDPRTPKHLDGIEVDGDVLEPTRLSPLSYIPYGQ